MALVTHFDSELHKMDVKTSFLNGNLAVDVYIVQPDSLVETGNELLVWNLKGPFMD